LDRGARHRDPGGARAGAPGARGRGRARRRLHLVHRAAGERGRGGAVHAGALALAPPRMAEALEAPRGAADRGPPQRGRGGARRGVPRALRRGGLLRGGLLPPGPAVAPGEEGLPSAEFFEAAYPGFDRPAAKLGTEFAPLGTSAGTLRPALAARFGLPESVAVAVGNVDSFVSVPGAGVEHPGTFVMV